MNHLTSAWARVASNVQVEPESGLPYDRYYVNERLVIKDGDSHHPDASIDKARANQQASFEKWRATNPGRKRPDRYKPENAPSWTGEYRYFNDSNATPGTVAFLDCEVQSSRGYVNLAYGEVRHDKRGQGLMRELIQAAYDRHPEARFSWGKLMAPQMGTLYRSFQEKYPERTIGGSKYY